MKRWKYHVLGTAVRLNRWRNLSVWYIIRKSCYSSCVPIYGQAWNEGKMQLICFYTLMWICFRKRANLFNVSSHVETVCLLNNRKCAGNEQKPELVPDLGEYRKVHWIFCSTIDCGDHGAAAVDPVREWYRKMRFWYKMAFGIFKLYEFPSNTVYFLMKNAII